MNRHERRKAEKTSRPKETDLRETMGRLEEELAGPLRDYHNRMIAEGRLIEAGWVHFQSLAFPLGASEDQMAEGRKCFMAGAWHLFSAMMSALDPDRDPTDADLARMDKIHKEITAFSDSILSESARRGTQGSA